MVCEQTLELGLRCVGGSSPVFDPIELWVFGHVV